MQSGDDMIDEQWGWCSLGDFLGESYSGGSEELVQQKREQRYRFLGQ